MARRIIFSINEIYKRRARNWEWHYQNRQAVQALSTSIDFTQIVSVIQRTIPPPIILIDGSLLKGIATLKGVQRALDELNFTYLVRDLICTWYWSQSGWDDFVEQFQSLPDVTENYYLFYDSDADAALLAPLSTRKPNANKGTKKVQSSTTAPLVPFEISIQ